MLAVSPLFISHAQEVRYYCMSIFLGILGSFLLSIFLQKPNNISFLVGWTVARALAVLTTPLNLAFLVSDVTIATIELRDRKRALLNFFSGILAFFVLIIPSIVSIFNSIDAHRMELKVPGLKEVLTEIRIFTVFAHLPPPPYMNRFLHVYILLAIGLLTFTIFKFWRTKQMIWTLVWGLFPATIVFIFSHLLYSIWITRYVMMSLPYLLLLLSIGIHSVWQQKRGVASVLIGVYAIALFGGLFTLYTTSDRYIIGASDHYHKIVRVVEQYDLPEDIIVWSTIHPTDLPLRYYYHGAAKIYLKDVLPNQEKSRQTIEQWINTLPNINSRLWLIYPEKSPELYQVLDEKFRIEQYFHITKYEAINNMMAIFLLSPKSN
jgi:uncharacterized membrane protein